MTMVLVCFLVVLVAVVFVLLRAVRAVGIPCQFCKNQRLAYFDELPPQQRSELLEYFRRHEARTPDTSAIYVCLDCRTVLDDFSGEKRSQDIDMAGLFMVARSFCKVCNSVMHGCEPGHIVCCTRCGTAHGWSEFADTGFRYFMPPEGAKVRNRSKDYGAGIA